MLMRKQMDDNSYSVKIMACMTSGLDHDVLLKLDEYTCSLALELGTDGINKVNCTLFPSSGDDVTLRGSCVKLQGPLGYY